MKIINKVRYFILIICLLNMITTVSYFLFDSVRSPINDIIPKNSVDLTLFFGFVSFLIFVIFYKKIDFRF